MKRHTFITYALACIAAVPVVSSCEDYFDTDPKSIINDQDYIAKADEMYKGFLGIVARVQQAGDHAIWLTDTRCNMLETTPNAPVELQNIYNYNATDGNEYADPSCYYAIVNAANDYMAKMADYHHNVGGMSEADETNFKALLSSALRLKVWAYYTLGTVYGRAYWTDEPCDEMTDPATSDRFTLCDMKQIADRGIAALNNGIDIDGLHIGGDLRMQWYKWLDEENQSQDAFMKWQYMVPPSIILEAELRSWRASYEDEAAAQSDWQWIKDNLLQWMHDLQSMTYDQVPSMSIPGWTTESYTLKDDGSFNAWKEGYQPGYIFQLNMIMQSDANLPYYTIFCSEEVGNRMHIISTILYDYANNQRNRLVQYLCPQYPSGDGFYLRPSDYGKSLYNTRDIRSLDQKMVMNTLGGQDAVTKYYYSYNPPTRSYKYLRTNIFEIEPAIVMFRGHDIHFLLAEAENHLGNWRQARALLNLGLNNEFAGGVDDFKKSTDWDSRYETWFGGSGGYGNIGIVGGACGKTYDLPDPTDDGYSLTEDQRRQAYDWALADEYLKEFVAEGKSLGYLCKIAERYSRPGVREGSQEKAREAVAERIAPKYRAAGLSGKVTQAILNRGYFIEWNLK